MTAQRKAIIVDIDGTIADKGDRSPFDWSRVSEDTPKQDVIDVLYAYCMGCQVLGWNLKVIFMSGRDAVCYKDTIEWITKHLPYIVHVDGTLHMRPSGDFRQDSVVKREMYDGHVAGKYDVLAVFDDRDQVVAMWRSLGLLCLQVAPGAF